MPESPLTDMVQLALQHGNLEGALICIFRPRNGLALQSTVPLGRGALPMLHLHFDKHGTVSWPWAAESPCSLNNITQHTCPCYAFALYSVRRFELHQQSGL